jgi:hypothetical protein
VITI